MKSSFRVLILISCFFLLHQFAHAQVGVSVHQSNIPFVGIQYNFAGPPIMAEFRISTDREFENLSPEIVGTYSFINKPQHQVYAGLGYRFNYFDGVVIPIGLKVYPIQSFAGLGLHIELTPSIATDEFDSADILRGSWGFHYIFGRKEE